jgi:hypothetical protein
MKVNLNLNLLVAGHRAYVEKNSPEAKGLTWLLKLIQSCFKDRFTIANVHDVCFRRVQAGKLTPEKEHLLNKIMAYCHANRDASKEEFMHAFNIVENDDGNLAFSALPRDPYINEYLLFENHTYQNQIKPYEMNVPAVSQIGASFSKISDSSDFAADYVDLSKRTDLSKRSTDIMTDYRDLSKRKRREDKIDKIDLEPTCLMML